LRTRLDEIDVTCLQAISFINGTLFAIGPFGLTTQLAYAKLVVVNRLKRVRNPG
jgi:hypothetical protein